MIWLDPKLPAAFEAEGTDAFRIASSRERWIERFGPDVLISSPANDSHRLSALAEWSAASRFQPRRIFRRRLVKQPGEKDAPILLEGPEGLPMELEVMESGLRYEVDFSAGYSVGLFCDQRENRKFLRALKPASVLNCFAYTCAFSVAAAFEGATTTSLDFAKKALQRGRGNFERNGLSAEGHRFIVDDVFGVLPRLARRGDKYDAIILDPPSFSRGEGGRIFRVEENFRDLVELAVAIAAPGCHILLSTNSRRMTRRDLESAARGFLGEFHQCPAPPDIPAGDSATTLWARA